MSTGLVKRTGLAVLLLAGGARCAFPDTAATSQAVCPSREAFTSVSPFLETGCGTLDCHGQLQRPLRIMGSYGLRLDPNDVPDPVLEPTTVAEVDANWEAVCGLQPEQMTQVVEGQAAPDTLLLLMKPMGLTHHKGNIVILVGDDGYTCLTSWLEGNVDDAACASAASAQHH